MSDRSPNYDRFRESDDEWKKRNERREKKNQDQENKSHEPKDRETKQEGLHNEKLFQNHTEHRRSIFEPLSKPFQEQNDKKIKDDISLKRPMKDNLRQKKEEEVFFTDWVFKKKKDNDRQNPAKISEQKKMKIKRIEGTSNEIRDSSEVTNIMKETGMKFDKLQFGKDFVISRFEEEFIDPINKMKSPGILVVDIETPNYFCPKDQILEVGVMFWDRETGGIKKVFGGLTKPHNFDNIYENCWYFKNSGLTKDDFNKVEETQWQDLVGIDPITGEEEKLTKILASYPITGFNIKSFDRPRLQVVGLLDRDTSKIDIPFDLGHVSKFILNQKSIAAEQDAFRVLLDNQNYQENHNALLDAQDEAKILDFLFRNGQNKKGISDLITQANERNKTENINNIREGENLIHHYSKGIFSYIFKIPESDIHLEECVRPSWLQDAELKFGRLELDRYWKKQKIALEYNGRQHYEYCEYFHQKIENFEFQLERDKEKRVLCTNNGVTLIEIPYFVPIDDIQDWIYLNYRMNPIEREKLYQQTREYQDYELFKEQMDNFSKDFIYVDEFRSMPRIDWANFPTYSQQQEDKLINELGEKYRLMSHFIGLHKPVVVDCSFCKERGLKTTTFKTTPTAIYKGHRCYRCKVMENRLSYKEINEVFDYPSSNTRLDCSEHEFNTRAIGNLNLNLKCSGPKHEGVEFKYNSTLRDLDDRIRRGQDPCPVCNPIRKVRYQRLSFEKMMEKFEYPESNTVLNMTEEEYNKNYEDKFSVLNLKCCGSKHDGMDYFYEKSYYDIDDRLNEKLDPCPICNPRVISGGFNKLSYQDMVKKFGYPESHTVLNMSEAEFNNTYQDITSILKLKCKGPKHHDVPYEYLISYNDIKLRILRQQDPCPICNRAKSIRSLKLKYETLCNKLNYPESHTILEWNKHDYEIYYEDNETPLKLVCTGPKHNGTEYKFQLSYEDIRMRIRRQRDPCPVCNPYQQRTVK